ncbi:MAG: tetratricopeptide repeat protein [Candidatus Promineifilaceae bacterium]
MNSRDEQDLPPIEPLTAREEDILILLGQGKTNRQIAEELTLALSTVKWYARQIYSKLAVANRADAVARARSAGLLPALDEAGTIRHNLPLASTPFVGRETELALLAQLIADSQVRLITISGPGGIGKTRLALEAAGRKLNAGSQFGDGIFLISLAPLSSAAEIAATLAATLDFQFQGAKDESEQLINHLRNKRLLLVMDNFEHLLDGRALVAQINEQAAGITMIITSRERLLFHGEQLFPLGGLQLAEGKEDAAESAAGQLFLNIARRALPDFQLAEEDDAHLLHICSLVEGMPLGLELAASWAGLLPLSEIAAEIEQSLNLLATKHHDVPQRHQSISAALDVSWTRLNQEQRRAFQELTVFRGGFTRPAALEVAGAALPLLVTLANKSWLAYNRQQDRYFIHELLRQYGALKLSRDREQEEAIRKRHSAYFCRFLAEREVDWYGPREQAAAAEVGSEIDNIQRAWRWAASHDSYELLAQGLNSLCLFYRRVGRLKDARQACHAAAEGISKGIAAQEEDAHALTIWAHALAWESDFVDDIALRETLLAQSQKILDRAAQAGWDTRREQAFIYLRTAHAVGNRDFQASVANLTQAVALFHELGERWGEAEALRAMGNNEIFLGHFARARRVLSDSLLIWQELDYTHGIAEATTNLGLVAQHEGNYETAKALHQQGLQLYRQIDNRFHERFGLLMLSFTYSWAGNFAEARKKAEQSLAIERDLGLEANLWAHTALIKAKLHLGRYTEAASEAAEVLALAEQWGHLTEKGVVMSHLGQIAFEEGDLAQAGAYLSECAELLSELKYVYQGLTWANLCYVLRAQKKGQAARRFLARALQSGVEFGTMTPIMSSLPAAALLAADDGRTERAVELYGTARQFRYISNSCWFADVVCYELDEVRASLSADAAAAAEARGRALDIWQTATRLIEELTGTAKKPWKQSMISPAEH